MIGALRGRNYVWMLHGDDEFRRAVHRTVEILRDKISNARDEAEACLTYQELSTALAEDGLDVPYFGGPMPAILESASEQEADGGRGLISALVVEKDTHRPGRGFFRLVRQPHLLTVS